MRSTITRISLLLMWLPVLVVPAIAGPVDTAVGVAGPVSEVGAGGPGPSAIDLSQALAVAWTQGADAFDVAIRANLRDGTFGWASGIAYLTTQIGLGTVDTLHEVDRTFFTADAVTGGWITLFPHANLTLSAPGAPTTFYLVLAAIFDAAGMSDTHMEWNTVADGAGAVFAYGSMSLGDQSAIPMRQFRTNPDGELLFDTSYIPASQWAEIDAAVDGNLMFDVNVPEPSTWLLFSSAIGACVYLRRRRAA